MKKVLGGLVLAAPSGQAPTPPSGAPKARGLTAKARTERSSAAMRVVFGHCPRDQVLDCTHECAAGPKKKRCRVCPRFLLFLGPSPPAASLLPTLRAYAARR